MSPITSSYLISNLHCPSCVSYIQETLFSLEPRPIEVSPFLVSSCVFVTHDQSLSTHTIEAALKQAGFAVCDVAPNGHSQYQPDSQIGYVDRFLDKFNVEKGEVPSQLSPHHLEHCELCRLEAAAKNGDSNFSHESQKFETMASKSKPLVVIDYAETEDLWRASLAIGGMTCAVCVGTITEQLKKKPWIRNVAVNLITNSAAVDFVSEDHKNDIVESINDMGYDAVLDSVVVLKPSKETDTASKNERTIDIMVGGMFCDHCPGRVVAAIKSLGGVEVLKTASLQDPILKLTYTPQSPDFTIRDIMASISAVDQAITPTIFHPPSIEERSKIMHQREQLRLLLRVLLTFVIAVPSLIIGIVFMSLVPHHNSGRMFLMHPLRAGISRAQWALFIMATPVYFFCADVFHIRAVKEMRTLWRRGSNTPFLQRFYRFGSMNMLMSLGTTVAYISSVAQLIAAGVHPASKPEDSSFYFDSVVFLTLFLLVGRLIEAYSKAKTGDAVAMLGKLRPTEALLVVDSTKSDAASNEEQAVKAGPEDMRKIDVDLIEFGDIVKVLNGGSPPFDGIVVKGESTFDESSLTGESKPIKKSIGNEVFSGTVNKGSPISISITGVSGSSMLDQIVSAVREGQTRRAPMERIADTLTSYFVPFVVCIAIGTWVVWLALGISNVLPHEYLGERSGSWVTWSLQFAIAVFVVACPCGLALAAPTALFVGGGLAAQYGILAKGGGEAFEKASKLDCVVFDKTGTLTVGGEPTVTDYQSFAVQTQTSLEACSEKSILGMVKSLECNSSHTIAKAIVSFCNAEQSTTLKIGAIEEIAGKGLTGDFTLSSNVKAQMIIGNETLVTERVPIGSSVESDLMRWKSEGKSVALAAVRFEDSSTSSFQPWQLAAIFSISDPIRPEAPIIIKALQKRGTQVWMLSGDNQTTANAVGLQIGIPIENVIAGVLPSQKAEKIQYLQRTLKARTSSGREHPQKRAIIAMVGDGINDSPALTTADVGIAIGSGSDIAISSAEFILVTSNLNTLVTLIDLSKVIFRRIKFNFAWALVYNMVALPVAAGVFYPIVSNGKHVRLDPVWASLAMAASSISVVCSSLLLRSKIPWVGFKTRGNAQ